MMENNNYNDEDEYGQQIANDNEQVDQYGDEEMLLHDGNGEMMQDMVEGGDEDQYYYNQ